MWIFAVYVIIDTISSNFARQRNGDIINKAKQIMCEKRNKAIGKIFVIAIGINEYKI